MVLYLVIPIFIGLLIILSFDEKITLSGEQAPEGIEKLFLKTAAYVYRRFVKKNRLFLKSPGRRHVRDNLLKLDHDGDVSKRLGDYYIKKISTVLIIVFLGSLLSLLSCYSAGRVHLLNNEGEVIRGGYGEGEKSTRLIAMDENGEKLGDFEVDISETEYTDKEAKSLYKAMLEELSKTIISENKDLHHVKSDLKLPSNIKGYPFEITWKSDNIDVLHSDGKVINDDILFESTRVLLTATITYKDFECEESFDVCVVPREFSDEEILNQEIEKGIKKNEEETRTKDRFMLPSKVGHR